MSERVVLAHSGEPEATAAVEWLVAEARAEVVAVTVDLGQGGEDLAAVRRRALDLGAVDAVVTDARDEFAEQHCLPALQAHASGLVAELARPLIAKHLAATAEEFGANAVVGFETDIAALAPRLAVVTPERTRRPDGGKARCPLQQNVWGRVAEPRAPQGAWRAPDWLLDPEELTITFDAGVPVAIDGETVTALQAVQELNRRAGAHGVGRLGSHHAPGATTLITAHRALEEVTLDPELARFKRTVGHRWGELVRDGRWYSPLKDALDAFVTDSQHQVSGEVRIALHAGHAEVRDRRAEEPWCAANAPTWYDSSQQLGQPCG